MEIGTKFKNLRKAKGITVYRLSKLSDVSENYIRTIEKGNSQPSVAIMEKLLSFLGTTLSEFFNEEENVLFPTSFERELLETIRLLNSEKAETILHLCKLLQNEQA